MLDFISFQQDTTDDFTLIKEAFEEIKVLRGISKPFRARTYYEDSQKKEEPFESVRPNPEQYKENFEDAEEVGNKQKFDHYEFSKKARMMDMEEDDKSAFKNSAEVIHSINSIKFDPNPVDLPNPESK
jgi:hypothetical protein